VIGGVRETVRLFRCVDALVRIDGVDLEIRKCVNAVEAVSTPLHVQLRCLGKPELNFA
jgi:hypothetical protein